MENRRQTMSVLLARHFEAAHVTDKAIDYLVHAGNHAVRLFAYEEAIVHFERALNLMQELPQTQSSVERELRLRLALGAPLLAAHGFGDEALAENYTQARTLLDDAVASAELFQIISGLKSYYDLRLELTVAQELTERMLTLADKMHDPALTSDGAQPRRRHLSLPWLSCRRSPPSGTGSRLVFG